MNFVFCDENCRYQMDGVCKLEEITTDSITGDKRCGFFVSRV